mmetsp:Transcript_33323/g.61172  ORF Transcript_33323/g.61172 Transcript_33323/m.61172 type:complete len:215 (-) Transcript_33323:265-909(-)
MPAHACVHNYFAQRINLSAFILFSHGIRNMQDEWSGIAYEITEVAYWSWIIMIAFVVMSAFVVVNLLIAVICDALQILRTAEVTMLEANLNPIETDNYEGEVQIHHYNNDTLQGGAVQVLMHNNRGMGETSMINAPKERMRQRVNDMQKMIDEIIATQANMARTIQYLSLALYAERNTDGLGCIREMMTDESPRSLSQKSLDEREGGGVHRVER